MYNTREYQKTYIIAAATASVIFAGRGTLGGVCVNTTVANPITILDGTSPYAVLQASILPGKYLENVVIANGLNITTGGASDITVLWVKG